MLQEETCFFANRSSATGRERYCKTCVSARYGDRSRNLDISNLACAAQTRCETCSQVRPHHEFHHVQTRPRLHSTLCLACRDEGDRRKRKQSAVKARYSFCSYGAQDRGYVFALTMEQFDAITSQLCQYCGLFSPGKDYTGIDRLDNSQGYVLTNCVPCCEPCNFAKRQMTANEFIAHSHRISDHQRSRNVASQMLIHPEST